MIDGLVAGRLHSAPGERMDKAGRAFVVAKVLASASEGENLIVNVIAFDKAVCTALLALRDGRFVFFFGKTVFFVGAVFGKKGVLL